jgi:hypothetical protein
MIKSTPGSAPDRYHLRTSPRIAQRWSVINYEDCQELITLSFHSMPRIPALSPDLAPLQPADQPTEDGGAAPARFGSAVISRLRDVTTGGKDGPAHEPGGRARLPGQPWWDAGPLSLTRSTAPPVPAILSASVMVFAALNRFEGQA